MLAEYGDDAAKPRLAKVLRQAKRETTGSHAGFVGGGLKIIPMTGPLAGTGITISPEEYYAPRFWNPAEYFTAQDAEWGSPKRGRVDVRSEEHTSELQSLMRISYAVFCLKKKKN